MRILVADDEYDMARALRAMLEHEGHAVDAVFDGQAALDYARAGEYDCLVLDVMMPRVDGLEVVHTLRAEGQTVPILLLTAKGEVHDRVVGLDAGADDYLPKPFSMAEFLARVRACSRRGETILPTVLRAGDLTLSRANFILACGSASARLESKEFQLMEQLMGNPGAYVPSARLINLAWSYDEAGGPTALWQLMSRLHGTLDRLGSRYRIVTDRERGYTLAPAAVRA